MNSEQQVLLNQVDLAGDAPGYMYGLTPEEFTLRYREALLDLQEKLEHEEQIECKTSHDFRKGLYLRRLFIPKGTFLIGKTHKTDHLNVIMEGACNVMIDGQIQFMRAPDMFVSGENIKKVIYTLEDTVWMTTHPTELTDLEEIEAEIILSKDEERKLIAQEVKCLG